MSAFLAFSKKEWLEAWRSGKLWVILLVFLGLGVMYGQTVLLQTLCRVGNQVLLLKINIQEK